MTLGVAMVLGCAEPPEGLMCGPGGLCPDGQSCFSGVCHFEDPGAQVFPPVQAKNDCIGAAPLCLVSQLQDSFTGSVLSEQWAPAAFATVSSDSLLLSGATSLVSAANYDFSGSSLVVELAQTPSTALGYVVLRAADGRRYGMSFRGEEVGLILADSGGISITIGGAPRWWRFRDGASLAIESSADGVVWDTHLTTSTTFPKSPVRVQVELSGTDLFQIAQIGQAP